MTTGNQGRYVELKSAGVMALSALLLVFLFGLALAAERVGLSDNILLPLIAISGVALLLIALALVAVVFNALGLDDQKQALGLPEGSIRAVIALALVVLFAILSVYLFEQVNARQGDAVNQDGKDIAKQLITIIGTLMTAVAGFYFGAQSVSGVRNIPLETGADDPPRPRSVTPNPVALQTQLASNQPLALTIAGDNLNIVKDVKITEPKSGKQVVATTVTSNNNEVNCQMTLDQNTPLGAWDIVVSDGAANSATLTGALTLT